MKTTLCESIVEDVDGSELGRVARHDSTVVEVRGVDGRVWHFPPSALALVDDSADRLRLVRSISSAPREVRIPLAAEDVRVQRRVVEGERVRVTVRTREQQREVPPMELAREVVEIDRVRCDREIDAPLPIREEDDVVVIPVFEEVLVVRKALVLREELRVRRHRAVEHRQGERVSVRVEEADVERLSHA